MIVSSTFLTAESLKYIFQNSIYFTAIGSLSLYKSMSKITKMRMFAHIRIFVLILLVLIARRFDKLGRLGRAP